MLITCCKPKLQILDMTFELFATSSSIWLRRVDSKILLLINWELPPPGEKWLLKRTSQFVGSHKRGNLESITILIMMGGFNGPETPSPKKRHTY